MLDLSPEFVSENDFQYKSISKTKINYDPSRKKVKPNPHSFGKVTFVSPFVTH